MKKILFVVSLSLFAATVNAQTTADFTNFFRKFQKIMNKKDSVMKYIDFPYAYDCNYFSEPGQITKAQFQKDGPSLFINGNAFIANTFTVSNYPDLKRLKLKAHKSGDYISSFLEAEFLKRYGTLDGVFVVAEIDTESFGEGYKAYFKKINNSFMFIGFEGQEVGD